MSQSTSSSHCLRVEGGGDGLSAGWNSKSCGGGVGVPLHKANVVVLPTLSVAALMRPSPRAVGLLCGGEEKVYGGGQKKALPTTTAHILSTRVVHQFTTERSGPLKLFSCSNIRNRSLEISVEINSHIGTVKELRLRVANGFVENSILSFHWHLARIRNVNTPIHTIPIQFASSGTPWIAAKHN